MRVVYVIYSIIHQRKIIHFKISIWKTNSIKMTDTLENINKHIFKQVFFTFKLTNFLMFFLFDKFFTKNAFYAMGHRYAPFDFHSIDMRCFYACIKLCIRNP